MKALEGLLNATGIKTAIVASRFNQIFVEKLLEGALDALKRHGADLNEQSVVWVPGSLEIPVVAQRLAQTRRYQGIICLGVVMKGGTHHFDVVAGESASGLTRVALETKTPIANGILTLNTIEQAIERSGSKNGNKGFEAATTLIETISVLKQIDGSV